MHASGMQVHETCLISLFTCWHRRKQRTTLLSKSYRQHVSTRAWSPNKRDRDGSSSQNDNPERWRNACRLRSHVTPYIKRKSPVAWPLIWQNRELRVASSSLACVTFVVYIPMNTASRRLFIRSKRPHFSGCASTDNALSFFVLFMLSVSQVSEWATMWKRKCRKCRHCLGVKRNRRQVSFHVLPHRCNMQHMCALRPCRLVYESKDFGRFFARLPFFLGKYPYFEWGG